MANALVFQFALRLLLCVMKFVLCYSQQTCNVGSLIFSCLQNFLYLENKLTNMYSKILSDSNCLICENYVKFIQKYHK